MLKSEGVKRRTKKHRPSRRNRKYQTRKIIKNKREKKKLNPRFAGTTM